MDKQEQAEFLVEALPYIKKYYNKIIVIKYGGNAMTDSKLKFAVMNDVAVLSALGIKVVLVHGGGPEISDISKKMGITPKFINGLRYTDEETVEIARMALAGKVNKSLANQLNLSGGKAIGLCGLDGNLLKAEKQTKNGDIGFVGDITDVDVTVINDVINSGYIPVIATVAGGSEGEVYNINADIAASAIAAKLNAKKLILMTDVRGLLRDKDDEDTLISVVNVSDVPRLKNEGIISGGMIPKIRCCVEAVRRGWGEPILSTAESPIPS